MKLFLDLIGDSLVPTHSFRYTPDNEQEPPLKIDRIPYKFTIHWFSGASCRSQGGYPFLTFVVLGLKLHLGPKWSSQEDDPNSLWPWFLQDFATQTKNIHKEQQQQTPGPSKTEQTKKNTYHPLNFHILLLKKMGPMTQLPPLPYPQPPNLPGEATALRAVALSALGQDAFGSLQAANQSLKTFKDLFFSFSFGRKKWCWWWYIFRKVTHHRENW